MVLDSVQRSIECVFPAFGPVAGGARRGWPPPLIRAERHDLDLVAVRISQKGGVIVRIIVGSNPRLAVVCPALERCLIGENHALHSDDQHGMQYVFRCARPTPIAVPRQLNGRNFRLGWLDRFGLRELGTLLGTQ